eukprot:753671-Hanusia_phi.AAC.2
MLDDSVTPLRTVKIVDIQTHGCSRSAVEPRHRIWISSDGKACLGSILSARAARVRVMGENAGTQCACTIHHGDHETAAKQTC